MTSMVVCHYLFNLGWSFCQILSEIKVVSERFFRSNRPGYPHPVSSELENSGIRVAVGDCSVTERRRWRPPYQTGKTVHAKHYKNNEDGRTAPGVCGNGSVLLSHLTSLRELEYTQLKVDFN